MDITTTTMTIPPEGTATYAEKMDRLALLQDDVFKYSQITDKKEVSDLMLAVYALLVEAKRLENKR